MGKKGNWITALKKAFTTNPKEKATNVNEWMQGQLVAQYSQPPPQYRSERDKKKWGFGRSRQHADPAPTMAGMSMPLYRQPSSIEKILGDAEMERQYYGRPPAQYQITPARPTTTTVTAANHAAATAPTTPLARERERDGGGSEKQQQYTTAVLPLPPPPSCSPPPLIRRFDHDREQQQRLQRLQQGRAAEKITEWRQPQQQHQQRPRTRAVAARQAAVPPEQARAAAVAIQAAFRGYSARRSYRSLRGLIRLQGVVRGPSVRRQTAHAMRCMRTLVRVQAQVRASRVEAMERRNHRALLRDDGRWRSGSQDGGMWDDSLLSRDEADARTKRKAEAVMKRERALAYAYSHQVLKATPMAAHAILADLQSGRNPWWWSPIDRSHEPEYPRHVEPIVVRHKPAPAVAHREMMTPMMTPMTTAANTPARSVVSAYYPKQPSSRPATRATRGGAPSHGVGGGGSVRDDESLTSCPAFGVPNYMTPTMSASAKARARAHVLQQQLDKERRAAEQKPRFSFGLGQSIGSWAKTPFWKGGGGQPSVPPSRMGTPAASVAGRRHRRSVSGLSVDSTVSMPAGVGRRTFR
ncbi:protein IQ-DOMAIN 13-like [Lolium rigidum]|uniref:protein IQ-DOMAIN 13-like n=1 Tax=Lolium rigidum TaxID=89674 RepID=UPI001F5DA752|nr:protein IQ-DOMAIN 13-like [Lolium rigidum]